VSRHNKIESGSGEEAGSGKWWIAWSVHLYTGSGAVIALLTLLATFRGEVRTAFAWMILSHVIDGTDGALARRFEVKKVLPHFDGSRLDDIVDYLNYVLTPWAFALRFGMLPGGWAIPLAVLALLASAYRFCRSDAKVDFFFTGFPSYWNVAVFYLYLGGAPASFNAILLMALALLVFTPIRFVNLSRIPSHRPPTYFLLALWTLLMLFLLVRLPERFPLLVLISLFFPTYYLFLSVHFVKNHSATK
jgi:phosphatidylcholine synthase